MEGSTSPAAHEEITDGVVEGGGEGGGVMMELMNNPCKKIR